MRYRKIDMFYRYFGNEIFFAPFSPILNCLDSVYDDSRRQCLQSRRIFSTFLIVQSAGRKNRGLLDKNAKSTKLTGVVQGCLRMLILSFRIPSPCARAAVGRNPQNFRPFSSFSLITH